MKNEETKKPAPDPKPKLDKEFVDKMTADKERILKEQKPVKK